MAWNKLKKKWCTGMNQLLMNAHTKRENGAVRLVCAGVSICNSAMVSLGMNAGVFPSTVSVIECPFFCFTPSCSFKCIRQSLEDSNRCPKCNYIVDNVDQLFPNFLGRYSEAGA